MEHVRHKFTYIMHDISSMIWSLRCFSVVNNWCCAPFQVWMQFWVRYKDHAGNNPSIYSAHDQYIINLVVFLSSKKNLFWFILIFVVIKTKKNLWWKHVIKCYSRFGPQATLWTGSILPLDKALLTCLMT